MNTFRWAALGLFLLEAVALSFTFGTYRVAAPIGVLGFLAVLTPWRMTLTPRRQRGLTIAATIVFAVIWILASQIDFRTTFFFDPRLLFTIGHVALFVQAVHLLLRADSGLRARFLFLAVLTLACAGTVPIRDAVHGAYRMYIAIAMLPLGFFLAIPPVTAAPGAKRTVRWRKLAWGAAVIIAAVAIGWPTSWLIKNYQNEIDALAANLFMGQPATVNAGFPSTSRLGSVANLQRHQGQRIALRVVGPDAPMYLRGRASERFDGERWYSELVPKPIKPEINTRAMTLRLKEVSSTSNPNEAQVWRVSECNGVLFTSLDSTELSMRATELKADAHGNLVAGDLPDSDPYALAFHPDSMSDALTAPIAPYDESAMRNALLFVPSPLDPRIRQLADALFHECRTTSEKIQAVTRYFNANYTYQFGIRIPPDQDPLTYFLIEKPPAHCEYFASGAVILLRLGGVPCRYVTGYVVTEKNEWGGYWIARNRDAHAWVEAYDDDQGWLTVEATVADGVPGAHDDPGGWRDWLDNLKMQAALFRDALAGGAWRDAAIRAVLSAWGVIAPILTTWPGLLASAAIVYMLLRRYVRPRRLTRAHAMRPELQELSKLLQYADRTVARMGMARRPNETIHQFAARLQRERPNLPLVNDVAAWYLQYAAIRFGQPDNAAAVEHLRNAARHQ